MRFDRRCGVGSLAVLLFPAVALAHPLPGDHGCLGRWVGRGRNTGFTTYWTIDLVLTSSPEGTRCGTIEYTNPVCGGYLEECRVVGDEVHTRENYTHRDRDCAPPGSVIIRCDGDTMRYSWIGWERVDTVLHRAGPPPGSNSPPIAPGIPEPAPIGPSPAVQPSPIPSPPSPAPAGPAPVSPTPMPARSGEPGPSRGWTLGCAAVGPTPSGSTWPFVFVALLTGFKLYRLPATAPVRRLPARRVILGPAVRASMAGRIETDSAMVICGLARGGLGLSAPAGDTREQDPEGVGHPPASLIAEVASVVGVGAVHRLVASLPDSASRRVV